MPIPSSPSGRGCRRLVAAATTVALVAAAVAVPQAPALGGPTRPAPPAPVSSVTHKVTLVTGDVVTVGTAADGRQIADVDRPDDAVGGVRLQEVGGDLYVIPDEAVALLGANRLDRRLFNVTDLIEMGYDDAKAGGVPLIVTYAAAKTRAKPAPPKGSRLVRELASIRGAALDADKRQARAFWSAVAPTTGAATLQAGVTKLWLDGRVTASLKESVPLVGAPDAWAAGYDGAGVTVAVLDTGVDADHPDLSGRIDRTASFVPGQSIDDVNGHGTHVASTIAGSGAASGGELKGVAPGADLIVGKVLGDEGSGQDSWIIAGMQWAAESGADVVNMSLGDTFPTDGSDPMSQTVDALSAEYGTLFVVAAGNAGPETISTPGAAASALTVAATDKQDNLADFSSTGPLAYSGGLKPDISAPGVDITAARSQDMTDGGEGLYRSISGTSMATPHVAGAAAIVAQQHPDWAGTQIKQHLMSTAKGLADDYSPYQVGTGRLDVAGAVRRTVSGTASLFFGNYDWPHEPTDSPVTKDLVYRNDGATDVTLDLTAPGGAFSLSASTVTVPAGGQATVRVTGDPRAVGYGRFVGYVVGVDAATGQAVTRSSVALIKEDERYDLTVSLVGRDGKPVAGWVVVTKTGDPWPSTVFVDGTTTLRMPAGTYAVSTSLDVAGEKADRSGLAVLVDPETVLEKSATVVLDARKARLLRTKAPQRTEDRQRKVDFSIVDGTGLEYRSAYAIPPMYDDLYVSPTEELTDGRFMLTTRWRKGEPTLGLSVLGGLLPFDTLVQPGSSVQEGQTDRTRLVYAGNGAAADYARVDAKGKVAVVRRSDAVTAEERTSAAVAAGAKALVVVNNGVGGLMEYVGEAPIPVATVHRDTGVLLAALAKANASVLLEQSAYSDFVYDLTRDYPGRVPDRPLVYEPRNDQLARIDARYHGVVDGEGSGYRYDLTLTPSLGSHEREWHPGTRTEWVSPQQVWVESHAQNIGGDLPWEVVSGVNTFPKGATTRLDWFAPAVGPGFSDSFGVINSRWENYLTWNVQPWSSSSDTMRLGGYLPWGATPTHLQVFQGDTLIHDNPYSADMQWVEVPAGDLPYRAVLDAERPASPFRLSTRTHTEWTFRSNTVDSDNFEPFSVMHLDYRLATDLRGDIRANRSQEIALRPRSSDFGTLPGNVTQVRLEISSDDGATWRTVTLTRGDDGWWKGTFRAPAGFVSVRAGAEMSSGYSIKQEIVRAYGVR
ncbi:S8 family serine peptidase [Asanoa sp. WMMD1127]|uniref:S8 family serine peptidase n=1 Tax=Asanoa sp. WMMD1127 TaxID=3016107 RepID=UPI002415D932|nr:S8 family serine peptidase [Asanoa sp. WMMD1127]MDG4821811.1 S8 family serine peptidase [Asanoa sp. WMMD1127]